MTQTIFEYDSELDWIPEAGTSASALGTDYGNMYGRKNNFKTYAEIEKYAQKTLGATCATPERVSYFIESYGRTTRQVFAQESEI
jgi:hypothetical protein